MSPAYFNGICRPVASVKGRAMLRSANYGELTRAPNDRKGKRYGPCSFGVAAPFVGTVYHDISETMTLVVNNSLAI